MKNGRPTVYTKELADEICGYMSIGQSIRTISRKRGMPAPSTIFRWLRTNDEFQEQYARAREASADMFVEDIIEIADNARKDKVPIYDVDENGKRYIKCYEESKNAIQRAKLRVDSRKWLAVKMKPKKYGDRITHDGGLNNTNTSVSRYEDLSDDELAELAKQRLKDLSNGE